eukprot:scaffold119030_cov24-Tisochrysis_lutea.AAC.4
MDGRRVLEGRVPHECEMQEMSGMFVLLDDNRGGERPKGRSFLHCSSAAVLCLLLCLTQR